jgi:hypothetical protein
MVHGLAAIAISRYHEKTFLLFIENEKTPALFGGNEQARDVNTYHSV